VHEEACLPLNERKGGEVVDFYQERKERERETNTPCSIATANFPKRSPLTEGGFHDQRSRETEREQFLRKKKEEKETQFMATGRRYIRPVAPSKGALRYPRVRKEKKDRAEGGHIQYPDPKTATLTIKRRENERLFTRVERKRGRVTPLRRKKRILFETQGRLFSDLKRKKEEKCP